MRLALKIDVGSWRGTLVGVPALVETLRRYGAGATFLFSLGPDHTGRALARVFTPGGLSEMSRTSALSRCGLRALFYGTLIPGPDIGRGCADVMRGVRDAGYEVGVHCYDHAKWRNGAARADARWTERQMGLACERFAEIFGSAATVHGAAGWQMNRHALRLTQRLGFRYASDCRGERPFVPVWSGEIVGCPQLPTTLPTLDELIGTGAVTAQNAHERLLALTGAQPRRDQVYTAQAELEGTRLAAVLDRLLAGWRSQGYEITSMRAICDTLDPARLPRHEIALGKVPGRSGLLTVQGAEFLADA